MQTLIRTLLTLCLTFALAVHAAPGDEVGQEDYTSTVSVQLDNFIRELTTYRELIPTRQATQLRLLSSRLKMFETRFTTFTSNYQTSIDDDPEASTRREAVETLLHELLASIDERLANLQKMEALYKAEEYIPRQLVLYKTMHRKAMKLMMVQAMAPRLEKLKAEEAVLKADIDAIFGEARAAVQVNPDCKQRMVPLEETYYLICTYSTEIQEAAYKPLIARIKDYLLGMAAVTIILTFFTLLITRLKAAKAAKKAALDAQNAIRQQQQYPQI